jgi:hypothetical protein
LPSILTHAFRQVVTHSSVNGSGCSDDIVTILWQDEHPDYLLSYQSSGKTEQVGRTGVAAMHAVLIRYDPILKGLIHCNIKWLKLMFVFLKWSKNPDHGQGK